VDQQQNLRKTRISGNWQLLSIPLWPDRTLKLSLSSLKLGQAVPDISDLLINST